MPKASVVAEPLRLTEVRIVFDSGGRSKLTVSPCLPFPFSRYGARITPIFGSAPMIAGGMAAIGSCRYCRRSSSAIGRVVKYVNFPVSGIISARQRLANSSTVILDLSESVDMQCSDCNSRHGRRPAAFVTLKGHAAEDPGVGRRGLGR